MMNCPRRVETSRMSTAEKRKSRGYWRPYAKAAEPLTCCCSLVLTFERNRRDKLSQKEARSVSLGGNGAEGHRYLVYDRFAPAWPNIDVSNPNRRPDSEARLTLRTEVVER
mmetsp:Transcript_34718/g.79230  ORF Transcript_34718/g.79230 Transcript_34718/m.79230 type:complete len:111 (-) Transcript_34718:1350-1682(-)